MSSTLSGRNAPSAANPFLPASRSWPSQPDALPMPVVCPGTGSAIVLAYDEVADPSGPVGQSGTGLLAAYLAGQSQLERFVSPGASLVLPRPAPYAAVQVTEVRTHEKVEPGQAARPVDYALTLVARAGIEPAPLLAAR
ncbi:hypothetical protein ACGFMK_41055 [Amycolatopsis sp. NPDC049252]|uniref:hypothetical protein n=1 Tax=Amycolatopsis sp. NPDC049252 TaxID=3363933 RepID=UPI00371E85FD